MHQQPSTQRACAAVQGWQNHLVLSRSVELMQQFLGMLLPARETQVYNGQGNRESHALPTPPLYEAVG